MAIPEELRVSSNVGIAPPVQNLPLAAGSAVIFNEACLHCTLPWMSTVRQRRAAFCKLSASRPERAAVDLTGSYVPLLCRSLLSRIPAHGHGRAPARHPSRRRAA